MAAKTSKGLPSVNLAAFLRLRPHRRITVRHLLALGASTLILSAVYYTLLRRDQDLSSHEDTHLWPQVHPTVWAHRAARVKEAFQHAYRGYEQHAFPKDEILPLSNSSVNNFNGWGVTIVDSLDTMLLMGLEDEYTRALPVISNANFSLPANDRVLFFETVIRYLGGLLSAYALSGHDVLREKADELGIRLAPAFNTTSGFPGYSVNTYSGKTNLFQSGVLAEIASCQLEYAYLGKITGKKEHVDRATLITNQLYTANLSETGGVYPERWSLTTGTPINFRLAVGGASDSGHEYTLKQFLLTARTDKRNLEMYLRLTSYIINNMLFLTPKRGLLYVTDATKFKQGLVHTHGFEHLSCFFPGLLALGAHLLPLDHLDTLGINASALADDLLPADRSAYAALSEFRLSDLHQWAAEGIAQTCYLAYADQPTGLGPELVTMDVNPELGEIRWVDALRAWKAERDGMSDGRERSPPGVGDVPPWTRPPDVNEAVGSGHVTSGRSGRKPSKTNLNTFGRDYVVANPNYYLRPETVESLYVLWKTTGDVKWRHRLWDIFEALERHSKTPSGYAIVAGVDTSYPGQRDSMPSYFMAETLKYLYLAFLDTDPVPLNRWVFNTEAHPLPVFEWTKEEREAYGIL